MGELKVVFKVEKCRSLSLRPSEICLIFDFVSFYPLFTVRSTSSLFLASSASSCDLVSR
jgi:hypothetical protein